MHWIRTGWAVLLAGAGVQAHAVARDSEAVPFEPEIRQFELADRQTPPPRGPVLFVGSSSIRLWTNLPAVFPGNPVLNRGFGGSTMRDLLLHFDRVVTPYRPQMIVVYEGDNDLARGATPGAVASDVLEFLDRVERQLTGTPVILLGVKASPSRRSLMQAQRDLNARMAGFARRRPNIEFADTFTVVLGPDGEPDPAYFEPDALHLNAAGYAAWTPVIERAIHRARTGGDRP